MATRTKIEHFVVDDMDGSEGAETLIFSFRGIAYEIDLSEQHAQEFEQAITPYISAGRRISSRRASTKGNRPGGGIGRERARKVRSWAKDHGMDVADRGRLRPEVVDAFEEANGPLKSAPVKESSAPADSPRRPRGRVYPEGIREWARSAGHRVGNGSIEPEVVEAFYAANPEVKRLG